MVGSVNVVAIVVAAIVEVEGVDVVGIAETFLKGRFFYKNY